MYTCIQEDADVTIEARNQIHSQPIAIVRGVTENPKDAFIVTEGQLLLKVPLEKIPFILLTTFYVFNMQYPSGCTNFFSFLEFFFLDVTPPRRSKLQHFITSITNVSISSDDDWLLFYVYQSFSWVHYFIHSQCICSPFSSFKMDYYSNYNYHTSKSMKFTHLLRLVWVSYSFCGCLW